MPFTFAHPAAVLKLNNSKTRYIDMTALVIGSMSPDFEYFLYFRPIQVVGHTFAAQFYYNLPLVVIVAHLYHLILKESVISHLPKPLDTWLFNFGNSHWRINSLFKLIVFSYSAIIGAFTHIIWDSFTHKTGFFVQKIVWLDMSINMFGLSIKMFKIMQHMSTLIGFIIIARFLYINRNQGIKEILHISLKSKIVFWTVASIIALFTLLINYAVTRKVFIGSTIVTLIDGLFIGLIIVAIIFKKIQQINVFREQR